MTTPSFALLLLFVQLALGIPYMKRRGKDLGDTEIIDRDTRVINLENRGSSNQEALEDRFIKLYITLLEKQLQFKEQVEPYKTDQQNAGKS